NGVTPENVWRLDPSQVAAGLAADFSIGNDPLEKISGKVSNAWTSEKTGRTKDAGNSRSPTTEFTLREGSGLPPRREKEGLRNYLKREDVLLIIAQRNGVTSENVWSLNPSQVAASLAADFSTGNDPLEKISGKVSSAWTSVKTGRTK